ncbi:MAG: LysR substrate-binding domain-containing protein, partial [Candidatus Levyibacteriota bacterium]
TVVLELATGRIVVLKVAGTPVMRAWHVVHREKKRLSPAAQAFKAFLLEGGETLLAKALA